MATPRLVARLRSHAIDDPAKLRVELVGIQAPGRLRHVDHQVGAAFELVRDPHDRHEEAEVAGERLLTRQEKEGAVLDGVGQLVDHVVGLDHVLGRVEVAVEECLGTAGDRLGGERGEADHVDA